MERRGQKGSEGGVVGVWCLFGRRVIYTFRGCGPSDMMSACGVGVACPGGRYDGAGEGEKEWE